MTSDERLDEQLREIVQAGAAGPSVKDDVMRQIEQVPVVPTPTARSWGQIVSPHNLKWIIPTAAAAAVILAVGLWPNDKAKQNGNGIAWADVVNRISQARTMAYWSSDNTERGRNKIYLKEPGYRRQEQWGTRPSTQPSEAPGPDAVHITYPEGHEWDSATLFPKIKKASRFRWIGRPYRARRTEVTDREVILRRIRSDGTRKTGESQIDGVPVVVFDVSWEEYSRICCEVSGWPLPEDERQGRVRVFVSKQTAAPLRVEYCCGERESLISDIQWDVPLADSLFQLPAPDDGWRIREITQVTFVGKSLKKGVKLSIGPPEGPPIATQRDIVRIIGVETTSTDRHEPDRSVAFEFTEEARANLLQYRKSHMGYMLRASFNGLTSDIDIQYPWPDARITITSSLEEFDRDYLTSSSEQSP